MKYHLLILDLDGTLVNRHGLVSNDDARAVRAAIEAGVKVVVCTGRAALASAWMLDELGLDGHHIFFDGALVSNPHSGHEAYANSIEPALVRQAIEAARAHDLHFDMYSSSAYFAESESWAVEIRRRFYRIQPTITSFDDVETRERIIKGTVTTRSDSERQRARELEVMMQGKLAFSWTGTPAYPGVDFINVINPSVSKGRALEELCRFLGVPVEGVMAIGDGVNDVALLEKAGFAVAMGNAAPEALAAADTVTADVDHGGVAQAVRRWLLPT